MFHPKDDGIVPSLVKLRWRSRMFQFQAFSESEAKDRSLPRDCATFPFCFLSDVQRSASRLIRLSSGTTDPPMQNSVKQFFDPAVDVAFVIGDVGKYCQVSLLISEPTPHSEEEIEIAAPEEFEPHQ
jgi:hypothetical protein